MSREHKFRGYSTLFKQWKYGYLVNGRSTSSIIEIYGDIFYGVIPESVGEYTGLKDKNGKEIYEGDVVRCDYGYGKIVFINGCFVVEWIDDPEAIMEYIHSADGRRERKGGDIFLIIGNIYENPDLLQPPTTETITP